MLESTAIRLRASVIAIIWLIVNLDHPDLCLTKSDIDTKGDNTSDQALHFVDCRVFRGFFRLQYLLNFIYES